MADEFTLRCPYLRPETTNDLLSRWSEPHRRHHDLRHLRETLAALGDLAADGVEFEHRPVVLATWFHDAVYDPAAPDNEERSAVLAADVLADDGDVTEIVRLIRMTTDHRTVDDDPNAAALSDADLSILGADAARYREYADAVRAEYAIVPDDVFRPARARILAALLDGDAVYRTAAGRARWEAAARRNVGSEIAALRTD